jgi:hypothetical protein
MGQLFDDVFEKSGIYNTLFFNLKSVLLHPKLAVLEKENKSLYDRWLYLERTKYKPQTQSVEETQKVYEQHAPYYPEFSRVVAITYAKVYIENGTLKRNMKKIVNEDEYIVLATFIDELHRISSDGAHSTPQFFETLCGHNIVSYDIPLLVKKFIQYRERFEDNKQLPLIIKKSLSIKPWESGVVDTSNVWKFNGYDKVPLMLIADYVGLKKTVDLDPLDIISHNYWELVEDDKLGEALEYVSLQSATQTNLVIQLMNELRQL